MNGHRTDILNRTLERDLIDAARAVMHLRGHPPAQLVEHAESLKSIARQLAILSAHVEAEAIVGETR